MKLIIIALLCIVALAFATNWKIDAGYGVGTGVATAPSPWAVLRFFPRNITIVQGDTITWTLKSDGHVVVFNPSVLNFLADTDNVFYDPAFLPIPPGTGSSVANPTNITSPTGKYSSGIMVQLGQQWTAAFPTNGSFFFFCLLHPGMDGYVNVLPAGSTPPQTQAQIDNENLNAFATANASAITLTNLIKTVPVRTPKSDGTNTVAIDLGYGDRNLAVLKFICISIRTPNCCLVLSQSLWPFRVLGSCRRYHILQYQGLRRWPYPGVQRLQ